MEYKATEKHMYAVSAPTRLPQLGVKVSLTGADRGIRRHPVETDNRMDDQRRSEKSPFWTSVDLLSRASLELPPFPVLRRIFDSVTNTTANWKLISDLNPMSTGHQRRTETRTPQFLLSNVKEKQDVNSSKIGLPPSVDTKVNLAQNNTATQKLLRGINELSTGQ